MSFIRMDNFSKLPWCSYSLEEIKSSKYVRYMFPLKKRFYLFIFRERGREGERKGEKHQCESHLSYSPTRDLACNLGMCPDWESNQWPFGLQTGTQTTEPHQSGQMFPFLFWFHTEGPGSKFFLEFIVLPKSLCKGSWYF